MTLEDGGNIYTKLESKVHSTSSENDTTTRLPLPTIVESHLGLSLLLCFLFPFTGVPALICSLECRKAVTQHESLTRGLVWSRRAAILNGVGGVVVVVAVLSYLTWLLCWWITPFQPPAHFTDISAADQFPGESMGQSQQKYRTYIITKSPPLTYPTYS